MSPDSAYSRRFFVLGRSIGAAPGCREGADSTASSRSTPMKGPTVGILISLDAVMRTGHASDAVRLADGRAFDASRDR